MTVRPFVTAVLVVLLATAASAAIAKPSVSPPPKVSRQMQWFRSHPSDRSVDRRAAQVGSVAVIGLESMRDLRSLRARYAFEVVHVIPKLHAALVVVDRSLVANASRDSRIRYLAPLGRKRHLTAMPNDPLLRSIDSRTGLPYEWQFARSHVDRALELSAGSPTIVVGTIDTGAADVPDLAGKVDARWTVAQDGTLRRNAGGNDVVGHGTAVASLIAANVDDGFGMAGFGGATHLIAVRAQALTDTEVAVALMKLDTLGVRIVNMSFGEDAPEEPILRDAIHRAATDNILLVAAAGNSAAEVAYPAADLQPQGGGASYGLAVGATDAAGNLASFSNSGERLSLVAPGGYQGPCSGVLVAVPPLGDAFENSCYPNWTGDGGARYAYLAGTSFSAPEVAGVAALIWARRPELKNYQVAGIIKQSARHDGVGWTPTMGCGVLDAGAALELAASYSTAGGADGSCSAEGEPPPIPTKPDARPTVFALPASGRWSRPLRLRFKVGQEIHEVAAAIDVQRNGSTVVSLTRGLFGVEPGQAYGLAWRAPKVRTKGLYRFCATLTSLSGKASERSCAPISLK
jgi:subtilisin family serine protease